MNSFFMLQELIQNAEDAGAQRIVFMLDHTSYNHREGMLYDPGLALYQVFNCAQFLCHCPFALSSTGRQHFGSKYLHQNL